MGQPRTNPDTNLWGVLSEPIVSLPEIVEDDSGAVVLFGGEDDGGRRVRLGSDPGAVEGVGDQEHGHQSHHHRRHLVLDRVRGVGFFGRLLVPTRGVQVLKKKPHTKKQPFKPFSLKFEKYILPTFWVHLQEDPASLVKNTIG